MKVTDLLIEKLNHLSLGRKLMIMQIFCVLLPLLVTDSVIWSLIVDADRKETFQEMNNIADSVKYTINDSVDNAARMMQNIYSNRYVNEFIKSSFDSPLDYYNQYLQFIKDSLYTVSVSSGRYNAVIYGDNSSIINGGYFRRLSEVENMQWYEELRKCEREIMVFSDYTDKGFLRQRVISLVRFMDYYHKGYEKSVLKVDINYSNIAGKIINARYSAVVYICEGDRILFSNDGRGGLQVSFERMDVETARRAGVHKTMDMYGSTWDIYVMTPEADYMNILKMNLPLVHRIKIN